MFQVFNKGALTCNQRMARAVLFGTLASIGLCVVYGLVSSLMHIEFSYAFVAIGYAIGMVIQKMGRGVQIQFSILGAVLAALTFIFADLIAWFGFSIFLSVDGLLFGLRAWASMMLDFSAGGVSGLLSLLFRVFGVVVAYQNSRIV